MNTSVSCEQALDILEHGTNPYSFADGVLKSLDPDSKESPDHSTNPLNPRSLLDPCEHLKLRMLAAALFADPAQFLQIANAEGTIKFCAVNEEAGHTRFARTGNTLLVLLPELDCEEACTAAATDLLEIYHNRPEGAQLNWILDFSSVTVRPRILFMGTLCSLNLSLNAHGHHMMFSWMKASLFPVEFGQTIRKTFELEQVGEYLVSIQAKTE